MSNINYVIIDTKVMTSLINFVKMLRFLRPNLRNYENFIFLEIIPAKFKCIKTSSEFRKT